MHIDDTIVDPVVDEGTPLDLPGVVLVTVSTTVDQGEHDAHRCYLDQQ